ncbi:MAG TPA: two-component regulator propeller domain-containing protein [Chitinophagaceae bacterium]|nr:two-component regulator propeller domain-containing protein [Chitinophagaceae bacterium]
MLLFRIFGLIFFIVFSIRVSAQLPPVGEWRMHLDYFNGRAITQDDKFVYCASAASFFSVDKKEFTINRYDKVSGLNDIGISTLSFDDNTGKLLIAYTNSNIDILYKQNIYNIPDIKRKDLIGDKNIYNVFFKNGKSYLSTGLGVIVADLNKYEIKETWLIGNNGGAVKVNGFTADNNLFYAATTEGLKVASQSAANLTDYRNWMLASQTGNLSAGVCKDVVNLNGKIIALKNDSLFVNNNNNWSLFYDDDFEIVNLTISNNKLVITEKKGDYFDARILVVNSSGVIEKTLLRTEGFFHPLQAVIDENTVWATDLYVPLLYKEGGSNTDKIIPNSPYGPLDGTMVAANNSLWVCGGSVNEAWNYQYNRSGFFQLMQDQWIPYNRNVLPRFQWMDSVYDIITIAIDPRDETIYAGSYGRGLAEIKKDFSFTIYKQNSAIGPTIGDPTAYRVSGLAFDAENNLWVSNFGSPQNFHVKKADGGWKSFTIPFLISENAVADIVIDDANQKWIVSPKGNGLICFNHGASIDNSGDDRWQYYRFGKGNGNLPSNKVNCIAKDKDGFIWVGTDKGIAIIQCTQDVFSNNGCEASIPIVQQDRFAGYLFGTEDVKTIAVDGANRKWVGTQNGVWLISANGEKVIYRFTEENSPLPANEIKRIAVDPKSGEVFISTFNGLCSFRSTATEGSETNEDVLVFPNPVPPNYNGTIAIKGLVNNAIVKITEIDGRLIYQTRALGGQAIWNGKDYKGRKISTGVYLVLIADEQNREKAVAKIVFIH